MTDLRQAAQQALEALESGLAFDKNAAVLQNLRTALEQPEQEPVGWVCYGAPGKRDIDFEEADINGLPIGTNLYTTPPAAQRPWQGLTDEERNSLWRNNAPTPLMKAIEAALKERNT
jgi:hypothetical protein